MFTCGFSLDQGAETFESSTQDLEKISDLEEIV